MKKRKLVEDYASWRVGLKGSGVSEVKPYLRPDQGGDSKWNLCTNFLLCPYKGCPHIKKHLTNYYYDGDKWTTCRDVTCGERHFFIETRMSKPQDEPHTCIEVKEGEE